MIGEDWSADEVPELDGAVIGAREGMSPVGCNRHRAHPSLVAGEGAEELAGLQVPEPAACGRRSRRVPCRPSGLIATAFTPSSWPAKVRRSWPVCRSQSLTVSVIGAREGLAAVGTHRHGEDHTLVASEGTEELAGLQVPEPQRARRASRREHGGPSGMIDRCAHPVFVAREGAEELAGLQVPEPERAVARAREGMAAIGLIATAKTILHGPRRCGGAGRSAGPRV